MKIYIETDDSQADGVYRSYRKRRAHTPVKEVEPPTEEEIEEQSMLWDSTDEEHQKSFYNGVHWILSKLK